MGSIPSFRQTTKEGPQLDPLCCLVEMTGIEPGSKYWIFNVSENPADSFADSAVGLSITWLGQFPQNLDSSGEGDHNLTMLYVLNSQCF